MAMSETGATWGSTESSLTETDIPSNTDVLSALETEDEDFGFDDDCDSAFLLFMLIGFDYYFESDFDFDRETSFSIEPFQKLFHLRDVALQHFHLFCF